MLCDVHLEIVCAFARLFSDWMHFVIAVWVFKTKFNCKWNSTEFPHTSIAKYMRTSERAGGCASVAFMLSASVSSYLRDVKSTKILLMSTCINKFDEILRYCFMVHCWRLEWKRKWEKEVDGTMQLLYIDEMHTISYYYSILQVISFFNHLSSASKNYGTHYCCTICSKWIELPGVLSISFKLSFFLQIKPNQCVE